MNILDDISLRIPAGTLMTPDMLEPAIGEEYRHRKTGAIATVRGYSKTGVSISRGSDFVSMWTDVFWEKYIHAKARP